MKNKIESIHLSSLSLSPTSFNFSFIQAIVNFEVPSSGIYKIEAWGAQGGGSKSLLGAYSISYVNLSSGDIVSVLVGERGWDGNPPGNIECGGGGGGTFIALGNTPLCVAGGSGSSSYYVPSYAPSSFPYSCGQSSILGGNAGMGTMLEKQGGKSYPNSGGGGGFVGNGEDGSNYGKGGISFLNGGHRQTGGTYQPNNAYGGFGGGASNHGGCGMAAAGGGYTGGSASDSQSKPGGGGGSYHMGSISCFLSQSISGCETYPVNPSNNKDGYAVITFINQISSRHLDHCSNCITILTNSLILVVGVLFTPSI